MSSGMSRRVRKGAVLLLVASFASAQASCGWFSNRGGTSTGSARPAPHFEPGFNVFTPEQDVELGRRSAEEIARQVPLLQDAPTIEYVRRLGARLAERAPGYKFPYQFNIIATRDINAFALPGGYIFVNAGAILAVRNEGELASIVAHEITHVALRHGTNQASKAYVAQRGIGILKTIFGGIDNDLGQLIGAVGGTGANVLFLRYGRTAERQADLEGARIMAEAGYDPRDMASFFQLLAKQSERRVPEFLSDHPDPGNRVASIKEALPSLPVRPDAVHDSREFAQIKARLGGKRSAGALASEAEPERKGPGDPNDIERGARPQQPSPSFREFVSDDSAFALQYPDNWDALVSDESNMIFAPAGAHGQAGESLMVTHGIFTGAVKPQADDLRAATEAFVRQQLGANAEFRVVREPQRVSLAGRDAYATVVAGPSAVSGVVEIDVIYTTATADGRLFYLITMAPEDEFKTYEPTFNQIIASVRLTR
ncbi:MAG: M48 family metalloprotease [Pyrinomonadaceae bacterium]